MHIEKGEPGYLDSQKKREIIKTIIAFGLVAVVFFAGYIRTGTRLNVMTVVAAVGCLPAAKVLVGLIVRFPYKSFCDDKVNEIQGKTKLLTVIYDMVITSESKIMPIDCVVMSDNTICGYTGNGKVDTKYAAEHIKDILGQNRFTHVTVKLFDNYTAFITRAEAMNSIALIDKPDTKEKEEAMREVILCISM